MSSSEPNSLKYPIGKFEKPDAITSNNIYHWVNDIELFPAKLCQSVKYLDRDQYDWKYRPDGWNVKQVIHHCADSHMNAIIRFKLALTEDSPTIKPYFEDRWANLADGNLQEVKVSLELLTALHHRWTVLLKSLSESDLSRTFTHPEHGRKIPLDENIGMYAWHCNHHLAHVKQAIASSGKY